MHCIKNKKYIQINIQYITKLNKNIKKIFEYKYWNKNIWLKIFNLYNYFKELRKQFADSWIYFI